MRRTFQVRLTRWAGWRRRSLRVTVHQVTLGGFQEALRVAGEKVLAFRKQVRQNGTLTDRDVILALSHPDVCAGVADVLCPELPRGWFRPWYSQRNIFLMIQGAQGTSDWSRLIAQLDFSGKKRSRKGGSLYGDAILLGRILGVNPQEIIDCWPMERFLDLCDAVIRDTEAAKEAELLEDPTMDPEAKPTPIIPGLGKAWVN